MSAEFVVFKLDPGLEIVSVVSVVDGKATVTIRINNGTKGGVVNITGLDKDYNNVVIPDDGIVTLVTDGTLDYRDYTVNVIYGGSDNFNSSSKSETFRPDQISDYIIIVTPVNITFKDDEIITVIVPSGVTNVSIWVNGTKVTNDSVTGGEAKFNVTNLVTRTGVYFVNATVNDVKYAPKVATNMFTVIPRNTTLDVKVHDVNIWDKEYVNVTIMDADGNIITDASGKVNITINGVDYPVSIGADGVARFNTADLVVGENIVNVFYSGDRNYVGNYSVAKFTVNQRAPKVNVTATNRSVDQDVTITVTIPVNATGYVIITGNFTDKGIYVPQSEFTNGVAEVIVKGLANGTYSVHITYYGIETDNYTIGVNDTTLHS